VVLVMQSNALIRDQIEASAIDASCTESDDVVAGRMC